MYLSGGRRSPGASKPSGAARAFAYGSVAGVSGFFTTGFVVWDFEAFVAAKTFVFHGPGPA